MGFPLPFGMQITEKKKQKTSKYTVYGLTPLGKLKADSQEVDGVRGKVLSALGTEEIGPSTVGELAEYTKLPYETVERATKRLGQTGYVQIMKGG